MRPKTISVTLAPAATTAWICAAQSATGAVDLVINGTNATTGAAVTDTNGNARRISLISNSDESSKTFTPYGKVLPNGKVIAGTPFTGPTGGGTAKTTTEHFFNITRISVSAATTSQVTVGVDSVGSSKPLPLDHHIQMFGLTMQYRPSATGSPNHTVQYTTQSVFDFTGVPTWTSHATMAGMTSAFAGTIANAPVTAIRLLANSGTGTGTLDTVQSGP